MLILTIILIYIFILCWQGYKIISKKEYKELAIFLLLWFSAFIFTILNQFEINIFNPVRIVINLFAI